MFEHEEQEILDVVDDNDEVVDTITRGDMMSLRGASGRYLHVVEFFLQRSDGKIYLPRRSTHKKIFPGSLDHSAAGHILSGETYDQAVVREAKEELGIETSPRDFIFIHKFPPSDDLFYFRMFYLLRTDKQPVLSPEHTEAVWLDPDELREYIDKDVPAKHTLYDDIDVLVSYLRETE